MADKHLHNFQLYRYIPFNVETPSASGPHHGKFEFVCDCGQVKRVEPIEEGSDE